MHKPLLRTLLACGAATLMASAGQAQLLSGLGTLPGQLVGALGSPAGAPVVAPVLDRLNDIGGQPLADSASLLDLRRARLRELVQQHRAVLDADRDGNPVRRGELIAVDPSPDTIARIRAGGFRVARDDQIEGLALHVVTIAPPPGTSTRDGLNRLRTIAPEGDFDFDPIFEPAGPALLPLDGAAAPTSSLPAGLVHPAPIGMIDGGVSAHPSLRDAAIEQRGFTAQGPRASGHGTAVASLMVGSDGGFRGAARGASLLVADVYGGDPAGGSALAIARALGWLTTRGVRVINMSLVGPANPLLERAIAAAAHQGVLIVAAVGNDGPAAPPAYPASYPGVIAVTGVDNHNRALPEAGKALHLDYAAPGADMAAALPGSGYGTVRGTSFAAPLVTARLIAAGGGPAAIAQVSREAVKGLGRVGKGIVCATCRIAPRDVSARRH